MADLWDEVSWAQLMFLLFHSLVEDRERPLPSGRIYVPARNLSVLSVLLAAARGDWQMPADSGLEEVDGEDEGLEGVDFEEILSRFTDRPPQPVVRCSVSDSMVSGSWGLYEFHLGSSPASATGYLYYRPDWGVGDDESLPILGAWEPSDNQSARQACILRVYTREWENRVLPPAMGQWASGDPKLLHEAILRVLSFDPGAWEKVFQRLREGVEVREGDPEAVEWVSQWCGVEAARVRQVLDFARAMQGRSSRGPSAMQLTLPGTDPFYSDDDPYWQRLLAGPLTGEVGNLLVALYVYCISQGRFASW
jgi:hypothetical protein